MKQQQISTNTNIFSIGGHSLIIMQLLHLYKVEFSLELNSIAITDVFQHPTITDHAQLINHILNIELNKNDHAWHSLNILTGNKYNLKNTLIIAFYFSFQLKHPLLKNAFS